MSPGNSLTRDLSSLTTAKKDPRDSIRQRIKALFDRHRAFDAAIGLEASCLRPDVDRLSRLKRARLRIKDEVVRLQGDWRSSPA